MQADAEVRVHHNSARARVRVDHPFAGGQGFVDGGGTAVRGDDGRRGGGQALGLAQAALHEGIHHVARAPDAHADADVPVLGRGEGVAALGVSDLLGRAIAVGVGQPASELADGGVGLDGDALALEGRHGVPGELLIEHAEDLGGDVVHRDADHGGEAGVGAAEICVDQVGELGGEFHACGTSADDGEAEELLAQGLGCGREGGDLEALEHAFPDTARVADVLHEVCVFADALGVEGLGIAADGDDELVVRHLKPFAFATFPEFLHLHVGEGGVAVGVRFRKDTALACALVHHGLFHRDGLGREVYVIGPGLHIFHMGPTTIAHGFEGVTEFEGADGGGVEERGEDEVVSGGDDNSLESGGQLLGEDIA